eukprot:6175507-Pleurochrysis_carterae.AAC.4
MASSKSSESGKTSSDANVLVPAFGTAPPATVALLAAASPAARTLLQTGRRCTHALSFVEASRREKGRQTLVSLSHHTRHVTEFNVSELHVAQHVLDALRLAELDFATVLHVAGGGVRPLARRRQAVRATVCLVSARAQSASCVTRAPSAHPRLTPAPTSTLVIGALLLASHLLPREKSSQPATAAASAAFTATLSSSPTADAALTATVATLAPYGQRHGRFPSATAGFASPLAPSVASTARTALTKSTSPLRLPPASIARERSSSPLRTLSNSSSAHDSSASTMIAAAANACATPRASATALRLRSPSSHERSLVASCRSQHLNGPTA